MIISNALQEGTGYTAGFGLEEKPESWRKKGTKNFQLDPDF